MLDSVTWPEYLWEWLKVMLDPSVRYMKGQGGAEEMGGVEGGAGAGAGAGAGGGRKGEEGVRGAAVAARAAMRAMADEEGKVRGGRE